MKPYGLISDCHFFNWSAFSSVDADGRNTRLMGLLNEVKRCAQEVLAAGGDTIYIAGDVFHVRGNIAPYRVEPNDGYLQRDNQDCRGQYRGSAG